LAAVAAVIAGLAVGIAFVVLFASIFSQSNPVVQRKHHFDVSIMGLKDLYNTGEKIDFSVRVKGYGTNCGAPSVKIIDMNNPGRVIDPVGLITDYTCDPTAYDFDRTWTLLDIGVIRDIVLESGHYKAVVRYGETVEKEFRVISDTSGNSMDASRTPVRCQEFSLCTYQLKIGNSTYPINFRINGTIQKMVADVYTKTLTITLTVERPTTLQIAMPREVIDARAGADGKSGADEDFAVFVDEENVAADEFSTNDSEWAQALRISHNPEKYRILVIPISEGTETVEIVATWPA
jgi:hypothetical protein